MIARNENEGSTLVVGSQVFTQYPRGYWVGPSKSDTPGSGSSPSHVILLTVFK